MFMKDHVTKQARRAKAASRILACISAEVRNNALLAMADALEARQDEILDANAKEVATAREKTTRPNMLDRLILTPKRIADMAEAFGKSSSSMTRLANSILKSRVQTA